MPLPTSSSTVNAMRAFARGRSSRTRRAAADMITATPALSSAPRSVVPSLVTMSCPTPLRELRHVGRVEHLRRIARQRNRVAGPRAMDDRRDAGARGVGARVDVRDEADGRPVRDRARKGREDVAGLGQLDVREPELAELLDEQPGEVELLGSRRVGRRVELRLRVDHDVAQEALENVLAQLLGERARVAGVSQWPRAVEGARPSSRDRRGARSPGSARSASGAATWDA